MSSEEKTTISNPPSVREKETFSVDDVEARDAKATAEFDLHSTEEQKQQLEEQNGDDEKKQGWFGKLYSRFRPLFQYVASLMKRAFFLLSWVDVMRAISN